MRRPPAHAGGIQRRLHAIAAVALTPRMAKKGELLRLVYCDIRPRFGLSARMAIRVVATAAEAYKRDRAIKSAFRPRGAMAYDERRCNCPTPDRVSLLTLDGRIVVPFRFGARAEGMRRRGQRDRLYRKSRDTFFLAVTVDAGDDGGRAGTRAR